MPIEVRVPTTGESVSEATVGAWLKREGDAVQAGEALVELETDKVNLEVSADRSGVLQSILAPAGQTVHPGDVLAIVAESTDGAAPGPPSAAPAAGETAAPAPPDADRPHASPLATRLAQDHNVDLAQVPGTGTGGRVTRDDVERFIAAAAAGERAKDGE